MNMTVEMMMMVFALIAIFVSVIGGFGGLAAFMWSQFRKLHDCIADIRENYVKDSECIKRREDCQCHWQLQEINKRLDEIQKK